MAPAFRPADRDETRTAVAARYAGLARAARAGQAITDGDPDASPERCLAAYPDAGGLPDGAVRASLGCGNPPSSPRASASCGQAAAWASPTSSPMTTSPRPSGSSAAARSAASPGRPPSPNTAAA